MGTRFCDFYIFFYLIQKNLYWIFQNIVACAAGFVSGLGLGDNTKAAVIRLGLMEMVKFVDTFYGGSKLSTFFESCGVADLITTCYGGRNRRVCEEFVKSDKVKKKFELWNFIWKKNRKKIQWYSNFTFQSIKQLEDELLSGQKLQGPATADEVNGMLKVKNMTDKFPLFTAVHRICTKDIKPTDLIDQIRNHPEHVLVFCKIIIRNYFFCFNPCVLIISPDNIFFLWTKRLLITEKK